MSTDDNFVHAHLLKVVPKRDDDYNPFGKKEKVHMDCSCGCSYFLKIAGDLGDDWGVCANSKSHRCGLLTFEHQGCMEFSNHGTIGKEGH